MASKRNLLILVLGALFVCLFLAGLAAAHQLAPTPPAPLTPAQEQAALEACQRKAKQARGDFSDAAILAHCKKRILLSEKEKLEGCQRVGEILNDPQGPTVMACKETVFLEDIEARNGRPADQKERLEICQRIARETYPNATDAKILQACQDKVALPPGETQPQNITSAPAASQTPRDLSAEQLRIACQAVPLFCYANTPQYSYWGAVTGRGAWQPQQLPAEGWRRVCAVLPDLPVCQIPEKEREVWLKTKAGKACSQSLVWRRDECERLARREIWVGMSRKMLFAAWGEPKTVYGSTEGFEEWIYGGGYVSLYGGFQGRFVYVRFENGLVKSISESQHR